MTPNEELYGELASYTLALAGLYLHVEKGFTGREVQRAHMRMAKKKQEWPRFALPEDRGAMTGSDVLRAPAGPGRDAAIDAWCAAVWKAYSGSHESVIELLREHDIL